MALYQKGTQRIEIIVRKEVSGDIGAKQKPADDVSSDTGGRSDGQKSGSTSTNKYVNFMRTNAQQLAYTAKNAAITFASYYVGGIGDQYGDTALQDTAERKMEIFSETVSTTMSIVSAARMGAPFGPYGMIAAGAIAAAGSGFNLWKKYASREREYYYKIFKENNSIEYARARADINLTTGRWR